MTAGVSSYLYSHLLGASVEVENSRFTRDLSSEAKLARLVSVSNREVLN